MSKGPYDEVVEEAGRRIYECQQARLSDQTSFAAKRAWRNSDVPAWFWDSYCEDARAVLLLSRIRIQTGRYCERSCAQLLGLEIPDIPRVGLGADRAEDDGEIELMRATMTKNAGKARLPTQVTVTLSVPAELVKNIDDWASVNYPGIKVRERAMLCLIEMAMEDNDGMTVDLLRG